VNRKIHAALTLKKLLGEEGIATELHFGVRKTGRVLLAHAWLEYEGQSVEIKNAGRFEPLSPLENQP